MKATMNSEAAHSLQYPPNLKQSQRKFVPLKKVENSSSSSPTSKAYKSIG